MVRNKIVTMHGEAFTLFALVMYNDTAESEWEIIATFRDRAKAEHLLSLLESTEEKPYA